MMEFIRTDLTTTTSNAVRSIGLKRFSWFHPLEDNPLYENKLPIYQALLRVAITNAKKLLVI